MQLVRQIITGSIQVIQINPLIFLPYLYLSDRMNLPQRRAESIEVVAMVRIEHQPTADSYRLV
jgi:hypothetical protein